LLLAFTVYQQQLQQQQQQALSTAQCCNNQLVGMCGIEFFLFLFGFGSVFEKKTLIRFGMSLVRFG